MRLVTMCLVRAATLFTIMLIGSACAAERDPVPIFADPTPSASPTPAEASQDPRRSPKALIRHWNDVQNAMQLGDTSEWRALTQECTSCQESADRVDAVYEEGGFIRTDGRTIRAIHKDPDFARSVYLVEVHSAPTEYQSTADAPVETYSGGTSTYRVFLYKEDGLWNFMDYSKPVQ